MTYIMPARSSNGIPEKWGSEEGETTLEITLWRDFLKHMIIKIENMEKWTIIPRTIHSLACYSFRLLSFSGSEKSWKYLEIKFFH